MTYTIEAESTVTADLQALWQVVVDVPGWPGWDPHEQAARLDGAFEVGCRGWSKPAGGPGTEWTITDVVPAARWASACALPGGGITGVNTFDQLPGGRVRCSKVMTVSGPLVPLFRLWFGPRIRRDMLRTFAALEAETARRSRIPAME
jgi:hypothetical protein